MRTTLLLLAASLAGCGVTSVNELRIPCDSDDNCPTGAWCDLPRSACVTGYDDEPPDVAIDGLGSDAGTYATTVHVPTRTLTSVFVRIRNQGRRQVRHPEIEITGPLCLTLNGGTIDGDLTGVLAAGDAYEGRFTVASRCASLAEATIRVSVEDHTFEGHVTVVTDP